MSLIQEQRTILAYLYETKHELPIDAELNDHCHRTMSFENRETEIRNLVNQGLVGSQTGFSGFFISKTGVVTLETIMAEEAALRRKYIMKVVMITAGVIALGAIIFNYFA